MPEFDCKTNLLQMPSSIDLILTHSLSNFWCSCVIASDVSDFHKMTVTVMKMTFQKLKPKIIYCRNFKIRSNLEKNFCPNYQWKTVIQVMVLKNSYRSISVSWTSLFLRRNNTLQVIIYLPWIKLLLRHTGKEVICEINS